MLKSAEREILNAHKYIHLFFSGLDKLITLFFLFINVKLPTDVGILTFMSRKMSCSAELSIEIVL